MIPFFLLQRCPSAVLANATAAWTQCPWSSLALSKPDDLIMSSASCGSSRCTKFRIATAARHSSLLLTVRWYGKLTFELHIALSNEPLFILQVVEHSLVIKFWAGFTRKMAEKSDYERQREERIARNQKQLQTLNVPKLYPDPS